MRTIPIFLAAVTFAFALASCGTVEVKSNPPATPIVEEKKTVIEKPSVVEKKVEIKK